MSPNTQRVQIINSVADLIRRRRNETGHPQDPPAKPAREEMYAMLVVFADYCEVIGELIDWLRNNQGTIT